MVNRLDNEFRISGDNYVNISHPKGATQPVKILNTKLTQPQNDVFVNSDKKSEKSQQQKYTGFGVTSLALATLAFFILKGKSSAVKQIAEHIDFKPAKTVEDAIAFGQKKLGIQSYVDFEKKDLEALNWANEGFVNVANKFKGKLRMPKFIHFTTSEQLGENAFAGVITEGKNAGKFFISKKFFSDPDKYMKNAFNRAVQGKYLEQGRDGAYRVSKIFADSTGKIIVDAIHDYQKTHSFNSAVKAAMILLECENKYRSVFTAPVRTIKAFLENKQITDILSAKGLNYNIEKIKKLSTAEQKEILEKMNAAVRIDSKLKYISRLNKTLSEELKQKKLLKDFSKIKNPNELELDEVLKYLRDKKGIDLPVFSPIRMELQNLENTSPFQVIYHEMGHIQDMKPRCKTTCKYNYEYSKYPPELKTWVDNDSYIQTANRVSTYAATGPGEFVAETFARMIEGKKLPEEVLELYKKLKGPKVPSYKV